MQNLIPALIKARSEFGAIQKDKTNPHYKSKYATLDAVLDAVTPALCKHGLAIVQSTSTESGKTELKTHLYHESGEYLSSSYPLPDITDAQKLGAALTYARRYALCALLSVTADEDDDGTAVSKPQKRQAESQFVANPALMAQTTKELRRLGWTNERGRDFLSEVYGKKSRQLLTDSELQDFLKRLQAMEVEKDDSNYSFTAEEAENLAPTIY